MALRPQVSISQAVPQVSRKLRKPVHHFQLRQRPWTIQPSFLAPVLPGETLKNLLLQVRAISDPIKNPLIGWWAEHYVFYVKHRDLLRRDDLETMMLDPSWTPATAAGGTLVSAANVDRYHFGGHIDWTKLCLERIVKEYFRDDGEALGTYTLTSVSGATAMEIASTNESCWLDSVRNEADFTTAIDPTVVDGPDAGTDLNASEVQRALDMYKLQTQFGLTDMSYEEFLATHGVRMPKEASHIPELVRYVRDWTYPTSHVEPTTGAPTSAATWKIAERADKDRFFREPGFLFGVCVYRPKIYRSKQIGSAADRGVRTSVDEYG
jgi:hypothetical protein